MPDETVPQDQQAANRLRERCKQIVPQLIAALDDKNPKVAEQCMYLLWDVPASKGLTDALVAKASDEKSPLRYLALLHIEKLVADPRVPAILDRASTEDAKFPKPLDRARWASLAGKKDRALGILKPALDKPGDSGFDTVEAIRLLGEIGEPAGVAILTPIAAGEQRGLASAAYRAMAKIDPAGHGLTKDQATLLDGIRRFKEDNEHFRQRMETLAKLNVKEIRPLVMQMLRSKDITPRMRRC